MSLLIRAAGQKLLDDVGLNDFHCAISEYKALNIVGECGKTFLTVKGVEFSRTAPSVKEVNLAIPLLKEFLIKYQSEISNYMKASFNFHSKIAPIEETDTYTIVKNSLYKYPDTYSLIYNNTELRFFIKKTGDIYYIEGLHNSAEIYSIKKVEQIKFNKTLHKSMYKVLNEYTKYKEEEATLNKMLDDLNSCSI